MGEYAQRLRELGLALPAVVPPVASYVPAIRSGNYVYVSGQLPSVDGQLVATGIVGNEPGQVSPAEAKAAARISALNGLAAVASVVGDLDRVVKIVKVVGFVASDRDFTGQPGVINGASELFGEIFGAAGVHARSAVGVAALPLNASVEVELIVEVSDG